MIAPSNRLLFWVAMLLPFAAAGGVIAVLTPFAACLFVALLLTAAVDAAAAGRIRRSVTITLPDVIRMSRNKPAQIPVSIRNGRMNRLELLIGLPLDPEFRSEQDEISVILPTGAAESSFLWSCVPTARGHFAILQCYFAASSPLGFWLLRSETKCSSEIRVYPDLTADRKRLAAVFLDRGNFGMHPRRVVGQGREFERLREYMPGDAYEDIHWKTTAKRNRPVTKLFQTERVQEIYVIIDSSRLSARTNGADRAIEHALTAALTMGLVAERQSDLFGLLVFSNKVKRFLRASGGKAHYSACRDALYTMDTELVTPDFAELSSFVRLRLRRRALLLIVSDLSDPLLAENFTRNVELFCSQHLVLVTMIKPEIVRPLFSKPATESSDDIYGDLAGHLAWRNLRELGKSLSRHGVGFAMTKENSLTTELLKQYMNVKARQRL